MRALLFRVTLPTVFLFAAFACSRSDDGDTSSDGSKPRHDDAAFVDGSSSGTIATTEASVDDDSDAFTEAPPAETFVVVTKETMLLGGNARTYYLAKPTDYDAAKRYPLVLSFHGNPGTAESMVNGQPFDAVSKREAIIAYPQGDGENWDLYTPTNANTDMLFIDALPDQIAATINIDKSRIYGFGFSGGAFFLTQFTCRFGGLFKAISVNAGGGPDEPQMNFGQYQNGCYQCPGGPIAALITHGALDNTVEPASGEFTHDCYATFNGCSDTLSASAPSPCKQHDGCPTDKPVKWCLIPNLSHSPWAEAQKEAWSFFNALP